ncbi:MULTISPECIES: iron-containing alcohol dehydrogenase [Oscillospiraceae]|uniref:Iron-containing alcohol dehydrogenase n=1 Tax=Lawsonibacter faecis TaxID=2763052 RepID=A0A8J6MC68_9FIRM|nr:MULTISPECIES: iron-containing alcohol dehydrogenase [Oscillospiraceae]MTQ95706.1 iron-containing alcohol dehydrogenase [Pseudoflavonifractor sp. BIOML-A16]MTR05683.1 iron-containing alcohol dehydrogenase [Pseudoflavonifractor sp. BIOML-A15]MTR32036.1 iron-containing alcohol dehydrogenase [Pseudoflavonifractor sp. BIOML-A14]MTR73130.1 iron-containing alcohol dehydrogenase [Pseudoflavonifractor sp. BIOML-A18]MTS65161.1 iron-containing alcohol dehydrogenase [Pseudoflavonifractor sp. BIOML-A5]
MLEQKVNLIFGPGKLSELGGIVREKGYRKAMVVCDSGIVAAGITDKVCKVLADAGVEYIVYDKVNPEPSHNVPDQGIVVFQENGCDVAVGVGGGSSMDCAKSINLLRYNEGPILRFAGPNVPMNLSPGVILIPTTSGTGSEVSDGLVMSSDDHMKHGCLAVNAMAEYAIVDPELMVTMPPELTAATGLDAFSHACEGYTTNIASVATDHIEEAVMRTVVEWLPVAVRDGSNVEARAHMAIASTLGGWMLVQAHTNAGHSVAHLIGSYYGIPHGEACAYATPWLLEFNAPALPEKVRWVGELVGGKFTGRETPEEIGAITRDAFIRFRDEVLQLPPASRYNPDKSIFPTVAQGIVDEMFQMFQPRPMSVQDAMDILEKLFA